MMLWPWCWQDVAAACSGADVGVGLPAGAMDGVARKLTYEEFLQRGKGKYRSGLGAMGFGYGGDAGSLELIVSNLEQTGE